MKEIPLKAFLLLLVLLTLTPSSHAEVEHGGCRQLRICLDLIESDCTVTVTEDEVFYRIKVRGNEELLCEDRWGAYTVRNALRPMVRRFPANPNIVYQVSIKAFNDCRVRLIELQGQPTCQVTKKTIQLRHQNLDKKT